MTFLPISQGAIATLASGQPAYTRGGFVTQEMINRHGSYLAARQAVANREAARRLVNEARTERPDR